VLREVPLIGMSLLGGVDLGPNSAKPFWGRGLALLGTGKCINPLPASAVLSWVWGSSSEQDCANPVQNQLLCDWPNPIPLMPSFFLARVMGFQPWEAVQFSLLVPKEAEEPGAQAS
jgi:hypothetical protein